MRNTSRAQALEEKNYGAPAPFNNRGDGACLEVGANDKSTTCSLAPLAGSRREQR